jgi:cytidyltransferase-like protein
MTTIVVVSGGFDPVHSGHVDYLAAARQLGDMLIVGINSDDWLTRKKGRPFMPFNERRAVVGNLKSVDVTLPFDDSDGSAINLIEQVKAAFRGSKIIFANGGDRTCNNIPEMIVEDVEFAFGVGGENKKNSSSWILEEWKTPKTNRAWGYYRVLHEAGAHVKLKELTVAPKTCLSMQRHQQRSEFWFVAEGTATVYTLENEVEGLKCSMAAHEHTFINCMEWHRLCNETNRPLKLIEIQYGTNCAEDDIERKT